MPTAPIPRIAGLSIAHSTGALKYAPTSLAPN